MSDQPIYAEKQGSYWAILWIIATVFLGYVFLQFYIGTPQTRAEALTHLGPIAGTLGLGAIAFVIVFFSDFKQHVEFYADRIVIRSRKKQAVLSYKEIKRVWKGSYRFSRRGSKCHAIDYPGVRATNPFASTNSSFKSRKAEILVWNPRTSSLGWSSLKDTPLILELHNREKVRILHVKDEKRVIELLKKHAPQITWSPVFDPMTRENLRGPMISN